MKERQGVVYVLHNLINDKEYVGQTIKSPPEIRWAQHIHVAFVKKDQKPLYAAMRKYGLSNFTAEVVWCGHESKLNAAEIRIVRQRKTFVDDGWGYNLTTGGKCFRLSKRSIRKIRESLVQYYDANPTRRSVISTQTALRMSSNSVRARLSDKARVQFDNAARERMSALKRRQYAADPTIAEKVAAAATKQWSSKAARAAQSKRSKRGWAERRTAGTDKVSEQARRNMTAAQLKRFESADECAKISAAQLKRYKSQSAHDVSSAAQFKRFASNPMSAETNAKIAARTKWNWKHNKTFREQMLKRRKAT